MRFSPAAHRSLPRPTSRSVILLVLALLVAACAFIDRGADTPLFGAVAPTVGAAPASAVSSAWYCPLMTSSAAAVGESAITIINPENQALAGTISYAGNIGNNIDVPFTIPARSKRAFSPGSVMAAPYVSALVHLAGGGAAVEQYVHTAQGDASTPCASTAAQSWYFADGSTESGASLQIGVFNPFTENAIVDASFLTSDGIAQPQTFQGVVVPPMKMVVLDVSGNVRRRDYVATSITLRSGRVAAAQLQTGLINGNQVLGYTVGSPGLFATQYVPDIQVPPGRHASLALYNPSDSESEIEVSNVMDQGSAAPFEIRVPKKSRYVVAYDTEDRIPAGSQFGAVVRTKNGVPVAAQLTVTAVVPATSTGGAFMTPISALAKHWVLPTTGVTPHSNAFVYLFNPGAVPANFHLTLTGDGNSSAQTPITLGPGKRYAFNVNLLSPDAGAGVVVTSDQDIAVSRESDVSPGPNLAIAPAIAIR